MDHRKVTAVVTALLLALTVAAGALAAGCGSSSQSEDGYKAEWKKTMDQFYKKLTADDREAQKLAGEKNTIGVVKLVNQRVNSIDDTITTVLTMKPPKSLQRLQVLTLAFMQALVDQLKATNELNEANISGQPTADLNQKVQNLSAKMLSINQDLTLEQIKDGIVLEITSGKPPSSSPPSSSPDETGSEPESSPSGE